MNSKVTPMISSYRIEDRKLIIVPEGNAGAPSPMSIEFADDDSIILNSDQYKGGTPDASLHRIEAEEYEKLRGQ